MKIAMTLTAALLAATTGSWAQDRGCASTIEELRSVAGDPAFPLRWVETTMNDGKPLVVSLLEQDGSLFMQFRKTGEGLWAQGAVRICLADRELQARIARSRLQVGAAAHWIFRMSARDGATFRLHRMPSGLLQVSAGAWSGTFAPQPSLQSGLPASGDDGARWLR